jgi:hypothetical protein
MGVHVHSIGYRCRTYVARQMIMSEPITWREAIICAAIAGAILIATIVPMIWIIETTDYEAFGRGIAIALDFGPSHHGATPGQRNE